MEETVRVLKFIFELVVKLDGIRMCQLLQNSTESKTCGTPSTSVVLHLLLAGDDGSSVSLLSLMKMRINKFSPLSNPSISIITGCTACTDGTLKMATVDSIAIVES